MVKFFLDRPVLAIVISIVIVLMGIVSFKRLPIEQFPALTPVQILVRVNLPGATAETMANNVAAPLEKAINGVENMIYMYSQSAAPGNLNIIVSFKIGTDPNLALINTQTRVTSAYASLPIEIQKRGVEVLKQNPNVLLFIVVQSENESHDEIFLANYANTNIANELSRIPGVGSADVLNAREYSMRIWLKPDRMAQFKLAASDIIEAVQEQSGTRSIGQIGQEPVSKPNELTIPVNSLGRMKDPREFEEIILRADPNGSVVRLKDVSRIELGAQSYNLQGRLNSNVGAFIAIYQNAGANALDISKQVNAKLEELSQFFPDGMFFRIPYNTTEYIKLSIREVEKTIIEVALLVSLVIFIFLHNIRSSLVPIIAMLVSTTGTFIGMYLLDFSINILTLFGLVLCIGIVVDDAILVVENIERKMRENQMSAKEAAIASMNEVWEPVVATSVVLAAVFIPVSMIGGVAGQFYKQFAITIAVSVLISAFVALSLSPVLSVMLLSKPIKKTKMGELFNQKLSAFSEFYLKGTKWLFGHSRAASGICILMLTLIVILALNTHIGLVPHEDKGLIMISADLPDGSSLNRVERVSKAVEEITLSNPGVSDIVTFSGYSLIESITRTQMGAYFLNLKNFNQRQKNGLSAFNIIDSLNRDFQNITDAKVTAFNPPDIPGIDVVGGFDFWIVNTGGADYSTLNRVVDQIAAKARQRPEFSSIITSIKADGMELYIDVDRVKARSLGVKIDQIYDTLQVLLGSVYINQFNKFGSVFQVIAQAEPVYRETIQNVGNAYVKSDQGEMIPLKSLITPRFSKGPTLYQRFNGSPAALISVIPNTSDTSKIISIMEEIAKEFISPEMSFAWGGLGLEGKQSTDIATIAFLSSLVMVFLVLAALYEKWILPISVLMTIPFGVLGAFIAIWMTGSTADIFFQVGIITLVGLSAKNAILIIEFAKMKRSEGKDLEEAGLEAVRLRFRAILMTSLTMIIGALPLLFATGAGAASRQSVGTGVVGGMITATFLALFFVPLFYKAMEQLSERFKRRKE
jgi:hydrophobe/amphiphile efflux-1 (HAE1) family protein